MGIIAREKRLTLIAEVDLAARRCLSVAFSNLKRSCKRRLLVVFRSTHSPIEYKHSPYIIQLFLQHILDGWYVFLRNCLFVWKLGESRQLANSEAMRVQLDIASMVSNIVELDPPFFPS